MSPGAAIHRTPMNVRECSSTPDCDRSPTASRWGDRVHSACSTLQARNLKATPSPARDFNLELLKIVGFEPQVDVFDSNGRWIARVDFYHEQTRTIIFIDGITKYVIGGFKRMRTESAQHNALVSSGHRVIRLSFDESIDLEQFATTLFNQASDLRRFIRR